ncbi:hypothetical protein ACUIJN_25980 [Metabacillus halosaccharovorans]|uniref:hypothetical protein n=1 Tax=Metabacillus TaxID=2675233 RepID=UPI000C7FAA90|nr:MULTISPECIES: hypothetical protein [Metabacillus]MCM3444012.1 hypothetical protein [Metabacillus halosaccharovorans]PMC34940.1 hypothetical protein CJ195_20750 [Bacillus sp. UMB0899]
MENPNWIEDDFNNYFSHHILTAHRGEKIPTYHVLQNPDGDGWVIGIYFPFIREYAPLEEEDEERLTFESSEEAKKYVDDVLNN